jgi:tetratricopeptide (TPR) repeat protein
MNTLHSYLQALSLASIALVFGGCANLKVTHIPPGESMNAALAKKAELVRLPVTTPVVPATATTAVVNGQTVVVEPELPGTTVDERVAEAYSRGEFCLGAGKDDEAIAAFEEAVKIDPAFTEAWQNLAMLYEKKGNSKKALEAFRRSKKLAQH